MRALGVGVDGGRRFDQDQQARPVRRRVPGPRVGAGRDRCDRAPAAGRPDRRARTGGCRPRRRPGARRSAPRRGSRVRAVEDVLAERRGLDGHLLDRLGHPRCGVHARWPATLNRSEPANSWAWASDSRIPARTSSTGSDRMSTPPISAPSASSTRANRRQVRRRPGQRRPAPSCAAARRGRPTLHVLQLRRGEVRRPPSRIGNRMVACGPGPDGQHLRHLLHAHARAYICTVFVAAEIRRRSSAV